MGKWLALCSAQLSLGARLGYLVARDFRQAIYWGAACIITLSVTL